MPLFKKENKEFFTVEELCKLRRAETEREKDAHFWFFGTFLACVVGSCQWGVRKQCQLISEATMTGSNKATLVTNSDEAFALLMHETTSISGGNRVIMHSPMKMNGQRNPYKEERK